MRRQSIVATVLLGATTVAAGNPDKPEVNPHIPYDRLESDLRNNLHPTQSTWDYWGAGWIPQGCKDLANTYHLNPADFTVFNVHYTDCSASWTFCRHKDAGASEIDMIDMLGRLPVRMRSYTRHFMATPGLNDGAAAWTWSTGDTVVESAPNLATLVHEVSHSLDWHALPQYQQPFSSSSIWQDNYNQDSATPTGYGRTNWMENFAETGMVGVYDKVVPGGIGNIESNWNAIFHQYATYQGYLGDKIVPGGSCANRFDDTAPVTMSNSAKFKITSPKPETGIDFAGKNITQIIPSKEVEGLFIKG
ncbi:hypothetical protein MKX08_000012 [Trichoderma sp. CBMAI-0020]|nr:hypothetical protein MKX08_000012 [Trichoderma sp. CBMAI-0020]